MKLTPKSARSSPYLLAFGAHPDDIEFGCGGVIAVETRAGRSAHFVVCSRGEAASNGTPAERAVEAKKSATLLGATVEFIDLDGDAHLELRVAHTIKLARIIRSMRPKIVLAPSLVVNQHPDHARMGQLVLDATRLARYGGLKELRGLPSHTVSQLFYYAVTPEAEPSEPGKIVVDVSDREVMSAWTGAMEAHVTQARTRNYVDLQLTRARLNGLRAGVGHAIALFPNEPVMVGSVGHLTAKNAKTLTGDSRGSRE
jgi:LmbE family N-acetylglucosaminyl deacetylase